MAKINPDSTYKLEVHDNAVPDDLQNRVYEYLLDQEHYVNFYDPPHSTWHPRTDKLVTPRTMPAGARCPMAWDDESLSYRHPIINELWQTINSHLGNKLYIGGCVEGMSYMTGISPLSSLPKADGSPGRPNCGWRVFSLCLNKEYSWRTKAIHRDSIYPDDPSYFNIVYFANRDWHPQLYGETLFFGNDNVSGDYSGKFSNDQGRGYPIGEAENVVTPLPGRFMFYDQRYLHSVKPIAHYSPEKLMGIVFRTRLLPEGDTNGTN